jgi:hypothetical protein
MLGRMPDQQLIQASIALKNAKRAVIQVTVLFVFAGTGTPVAHRRQHFPN